MLMMTHERVEVQEPGVFRCDIFQASIATEHINVGVTMFEH